MARTIVRWRTARIQKKSSAASRPTTATKNTLAVPDTRLKVRRLRWSKPSLAARMRAAYDEVREFVTPESTTAAGQRMT
jgi:hypothetical protein